MTTVLWVAGVLFFASVITANLMVWSHVMAKTDGISSWLKRNLPGINILAIVAGASVVGALIWQVADMRLEMRREFAELNREVYQSDNSLKVQTALMKADLEYVRPRVIRDDFEKEIARLNQEIDKLREENRLLQRQIDALNAQLLTEKRNKS